VPEARKVMGARGEPRKCRMSENNTTNALQVGLLERILNDRNLQKRLLEDIKFMDS
jgi:hypothetical protein